MMLTLRSLQRNHCAYRCMSTATILHTSEIDGSKEAVYLHGLLGNGKNLTTMAKRFGGGHLPDLRGHGKSPSGSGPHTFENCAKDVLVSTDGSPSTIVGHSFGGRVALECAVLRNNEDDATTTWLLDTVPGQANDSVEQVIASVQSVDPGNYKTRKDVSQDLQQKQNLDVGLAQWLASSMMTDDQGRLTWGFDVNVVNDLMAEFASQDFMGKIEHLVLSEDSQSTIHLVRGGKNTGWSVNVVSKLQELSNRSKGRFHVHTLPKAGHWVHVDDLPGLVDLWTSHS